MIRPFFPIALVLTLLIVSPADACCVWDRDTLASEAAGAPDLIEVIVGKIDRFPKKYYEIREKRLVEMAAANDPVRFDDLAICLLKIRADAEHWDTLALRKLDEKDRLVAKLIADNALPESDSRTHYYRSNISGAMVITLDTFEVMAKSSKAANS
ncbi:MAG: hypothetical protein IT462_13980, partial [Planctomycetes bacterium]|nr:hypothetical protein [Planctomycetota bacterium]